MYRSTICMICMICDQMAEVRYILDNNTTEDDVIVIRGCGMQSPITRRSRLCIQRFHLLINAWASHGIVCRASQDARRVRPRTTKRLMLQRH